MPEGIVRRSPARNKPVGIDIIRVKGGKAVHFDCVSSSFIGLLTHWTGRGARRCPEKDCDYCAKNSEVRPRGYVIGVANGSKNVALFEFTAGCLDEFADFEEENGSLRGAHVKLYRRGQRDTSQLNVTFGEHWTRSAELPEEPDIVDIVCRIYGITAPSVIESMKHAYRGAPLPSILPQEPVNKRHIG